MTNTLNIIDFNEITISKQSINSAALSIADMVNNGDASPIAAIIKLKAFADLYDEVRPMLNDAIIHEIDNGNNEVHGVTLSTMETGIKYDFSTTKKWVELNHKKTLIDQELKVLETTIKTLTRPMQILDEETGELIEIKPAKRSSKTSFKINYK